MSNVYFHIKRPAAWIQVTGEDCFEFLQGQFSNDLRSPAPAPATYGLWLDRKGKVLADSFILQKNPEEFYLFSATSPAQTILDRLEPYIIADDVALRDLTDTSDGAILWGDRTDDVLTACGFERPDRGSFLQRDRRFLFPGRRSRETNVELIISGSDGEETLAALSAAVKNAGGEIVDERTLETERISGGLPAIPRDAGPQDLPQEAGLEETGISYTKGCYTGQEVMARIRSMGQVRRVLAQVEIEGQTPDLPAPLFAGEREIGSLRSAAGSSPQIGLALVRREVADADAQFSFEPAGPLSTKIVQTYS